ncbi:MAG: energy-coupling factor transporter ATPase [Firmicutes bacterium]|uniref:Energy-coupling factor transporter ATPase n=1 Tax=Candidatus Onthovivens merdipullorum TaxID=2840889 RepID=A0A9D9DMK5_9BACL|nr:energy-coupling factor transporter ATPase [Candidatus Onthovivens merdipullorum]
MNEALRLEHIYFGYEEDLDTLIDVSFSVKKGDYVTLIGHNGSGKSTLAKIISFLLNPNSGKIFINEEEINSNDENKLKNIRKIIGIVFQNPDNQFIGSTVEDDIAFGLENRNTDVKKMKELVYEYAKKVNMDKFLNKEPSELSGGQKQRVAIAGILALNLKIIIFDEATSMLDPEGVEDIKRLIFEMREKDPTLTFISITHDIEEAYLSDYCIVLNKGKILKEGKPFEVFQNEELISSTGLDIPFVLKVKNALKDNGIEISENIKTIDELGEYICKLK